VDNAGNFDSGVTPTWGAHGTHTKFEPEFDAGMHTPIAEWFGRNTLCRLPKSFPPSVRIAECFQSSRGYRFGTTRIWAIMPPSSCSRMTDDQ